MTIKNATLGTLAAVLACTLAACSQPGSSSSTPEVTGPVTRHLQATDGTPDLDTFQAQAEDLPEAISVADAKRLLVNIDDSKVDKTPKYGLNWFRGLGWGWRGFGGLGYGALSYYPYGSYYYPYSLYGNYYYPYSYGAYSPFLYGGYGLYSPYYYGLGAFGSGFFNRGFGHGFHGHGHGGHGGHGGHHR